jgi:hypothetical protein
MAVIAIDPLRFIEKQFSMAEPLTTMKKTNTNPNQI